MTTNYKSVLITLILIVVASSDLFAQSSTNIRRVTLLQNKAGGVNTLTREMVRDANTIYTVQSDFVLGSDITLPDNCTLNFEGGSIRGNKKLLLNNAVLKGNPSIECDFEGTIANEVINVAWFGVEPEKDCHARFQKVLDLYASNVPNNPWDFWPKKPEPKIVIPNGVYDLGEVNIRSYLTIEGQGIGATVLRNTCFKGSDIYNIKISNLVLRNGTKSIATDAISLDKKKTYKVAIDIDHGSFVVMENVAIQNYDIGIYLNRCYNFETYSCQIKYCSIGLQTEGPSDGDACHALNIYGGVITSYNYGIVLNKGFGVNIGRTTIEGGNYGIYSKSIGSMNVFNNYFERNKIADLYGVLLNTTFYDNYIANSGKTAKSYYIYATALLFSNIYNNFFSPRNSNSTIPYIELANNVTPQRISIYGNDVGGTHALILNDKLTPNSNVGDGFIPGNGSWELNPGGHLSVFRNTTYGNLVLRLETAQGPVYFKGDKSTRGRLISEYNTNDLDANSEGDGFYNTKDKIPVWWEGSSFKEADGAVAGVKRSGTFSEKPKAKDIYVGFKYFCTDRQTPEGKTNGIEIIHKGNNVWVDALGRQVK